MVQPELKAVVIVCPHCGTRYQLSAETIGSGRLVQCASCLKSWQATMPDSASFTPPPPDDDALFDADAEAELDANFEAEQRRAAQIAAVRTPCRRRCRRQRRRLQPHLRGLPSRRPTGSSRRNTPSAASR